MPRVVTLELNELDFELVQRYIDEGRLPALRRLLASHDLHRTEAEPEYAHLEPWIQWVTAHTGKTFAQHGVFRLGDIVDRDIPQVWDVLERRGLRVAAMSPMNARNSLRAPAFFVPDPWTRTAVSGSWDLQLLMKAVVQAVNDNAHARITPLSYARLAVGAAVNMRRTNLPKYIDLALTSKTRRWRRALLLDLLLSDAFVRHVRASKPDYASLFLNAGAHVQHHYMFSSKHYRGPLANPTWYVDGDVDPVGEAYEIYDRIVANVLAALPDVRLLLCTGLSQRPNQRVVHYYRPKHHASLLDALGVRGVVEIQPRMSRDFLVVFGDASDALDAQHTLESFVAADGAKVFTVENRGTTLFCMLSYTAEITPVFSIAGRTRTIDDFAERVTHVSIENAIHRSTGYFLDSGEPRTGRSDVIPLADVFTRTLSIWEHS